MIPSRVTGAIDAVDGWLDRLRLQLTPGQRWTSALGFALALALLLFGLPTHLRVIGAPAPPSHSPLAGTGGVASRAAPEAVAAEPEPPATPVWSPPAADVTAREAPSVDAPRRAVSAMAAGVVVALVRSGDGAPGRDDEAMARAAASAASVPVTLVAFDPADAGACGRVPDDTAVVIAATDLGAVRGCLLDRRIVVVARDAGGSVPASPRRADLLSSLPGPGEALGALVEPRGRAGVRGRVGIVAQAASKPAVERAVVRLRAAGLDVRATAYLATDPAGLGAIPDAVRTFSAVGVETTVFAVPVAQQRAWTLQEALLLPGARHVVVDAADAVSDEAYPPTFEGAVALTTVRSPWYERAHGQTPEQAACVRRWSEVAAPGALTAAEHARVLSWCDLVAVASAGVAAAGSGDVGRSLRSRTVAAALTSDLGPLPGGGWGPRQMAVLTWKAACACWQERSHLADRQVE